jgi:hypothetical protein
VGQRKLKNPGHIIVAINSKATEGLPQAPTANDVHVFMVRRRVAHQADLE